MDVDEMAFLVIPYKEKIPENYSLATVAQARDDIDGVKIAYDSFTTNARPLEVRLKNGLLEHRGGGELSIERDYEIKLKYKLVTNQKSGKEVTEEDFLIALAYAAEHDDVDEVVELIECAGTKILKTPMPLTELGTVLHVCADWASLKTLEKVCLRHPESVDVYVVDRDGDTALHNLPNQRVSKSYEDCKEAASSLLNVGGVNANRLLAIRSNYGDFTALCKALVYGREDVCRALLDAAKEKEEKDPATAEKEKEEKDPHWLTLTAHGVRIAFAYLKHLFTSSEMMFARAISDVHTIDHDRAFCTALHLAVLKGYKDVVSNILGYPGARELNLTSIPDHEGNTPLHVTAGLEDAELCSMLLKHSMEIKGEGRGVRSTNKAGETPLHIASAHGRTEVCEKLLRYGASLSSPDNSGRFALTNAFSKGHTEVVKKLLDACLPTRAQDLPSTSAESGLGLIIAESKGGLINERFQFGLTPLHVATAISSEYHVSKLMKSGALVDSVSDDGRTPLHVAAQRKDSKVFTKLLEARMKLNMKQDRKQWINISDKSGQTALHNVVRLEKLKAVDEVETGEDKMAAQESTDDIPEKESNESGAEKTSGEEIEAEDTKDEVACNMVRLLLKEGAWVDMQDCNGETPLHEAARTHHKVLCTLLDEATGHNFHSGDASARDDWISMCDFSGETALHEAARIGCLHSVRHLLKETKSRDDLLWVRDMENKTALDWAALQRKERIIGEMMAKDVVRDITRKFLMWNLKEYIHPDVHASYCKKYEVKEDQTSLLKAAVKEEDVDIARELINRGADVTALDHDAHQWLTRNLGKMASDQPTSEDTLGRRELVHGVATLLLNPYTETPITIGIFGGWGTGKSSFMLQVEEAILYMALKETFRKTPHFPSHGKESSTIKFSRGGSALRCMVVKVLKQIITNKNASRESLFAKLVKTLEQRGLEQAREALLAELVKTLEPTTSKALKQVNSNKNASRESLLTKLVKTLKQTGLEQAREALLAKLVKTLKPTISIADIENQMPLKDENDIIDNLPMELMQSNHCMLFKSLALTDRSKLVHSHARALGKRKAGMYNQILQDAHLVSYTPAILTLHYNAWQYDNKNEASAGLAVEITKCLESFMTPHQWLRMCWEYSWRSQPGGLFVHLFLPILLAVMVLCGIIIIWKFLPLATIYKALSLPVGIVGVMGAFFKAFLQIIQPVTKSMLKSLDHRSMLGYQHQVIDDIKFLRHQLCADTHFGWKILGFLCQLFISNSYFMEGTWIWKQHPYLNNFRFVVFIDDLDRCDEKTILEMLRAINLILGSCGINVVIGVDKDMLHHALIKEFFKDMSDKGFDICVDSEVFLEEKGSQAGEKEGIDSQKKERSDKVAKAHKDLSIRELADNYLQKIIQLPIQMPDPSKKHMEQFLQCQVGQSLRRQKRKKVEDSKLKAKLDYKKEVEDTGSVTHKLSMDEEDVDGEQVRPKGDPHSLDRVHNATSEAVTFHLLLTNYSPMEKDILKDLCQSKGRRIPREWKRFLNYHRLAWTILSQDSNMKSEEFKGWRIKLILWIFICWNWRDQMDVIFKNWNFLISEILQKQDKDTHGDNRLKLCDILIVYMKSIKEWNPTEDVGKKTGKEVPEKVPKAWQDLHKTLEAEYDIPMHFIEKFQQYRFYCVLDHLETGQHFQA